MSFYDFALLLTRFEEETRDKMKERKTLKGGKREE